jgi:hypothetical protein
MSYGDWFSRDVIIRRWFEDKAAACEPTSRADVDHQRKATELIRITGIAERQKNFRGIKKGLRIPQPLGYFRSKMKIDASLFSP